MQQVEDVRFAVAQLSGDPSLIDVVRIASRLTKSDAQVVLFDDHRAVVVAALGSSVLQPRPLRPTEQAIADGDTGHQIDDRFTSFPILCSRPGLEGRAIGALTVAEIGESVDPDVMHGLARLCGASATQAMSSAKDEDFSHTVLHSLRDAVLVLDKDFQILFANRAISSQLGYNPAELVGRNAVELVHPEDVDSALTSLAKLSGGDEVYRLVLRAKHSNGDYNSTDITGRDMTADPRVGGIILSLRDGNYDREVTDTLNRNERLSKAIVEQLHDGIIATDALGSLLVVNDSARRILGLDANVPAATFKLDEMKFLDTLGHLAQGPLHPIRQVLSGRQFDGTEMATISDSVYRNLVVAGRPVLGSDGETIGTVIGLHDVTDARRTEREFRLRSLHDQLTGLPNRRKMEEQLATYLNRDPDLLVTACLIDLDNFKLINDTHGHRVGDEVLRAATKKVQSGREITDLVVRLGGDEFVVLFDSKTAEEALRTANQIMVELRHPVTIEGMTFPLTASVGVAQVRASNIASGDLLRHADLALYSAKAQGRNRAELFTSKLANAAKVADSQRETLRRALDENALEMYFQPLVDSTTNRLLGFESLARCRSRNGSLISPGGFVDAASGSGLIWELDSKAFDLSCKAAAAIALVEGGLGVACNFSGLSIVQPDFVSTVEETLSRYNIDPASMCIEITESAAFEAGPAALDALRALHERGMKLALDDFGTGYSSLSHIRDLPLSVVKVDRSFVGRLEPGSAEHAISKAIVALAADLDLTVVAEGVETQAQLDIARQMGFNVIQGWFYSPAKSLRDILAMLTDQGGNSSTAVPAHWQQLKQAS